MAQEFADIFLISLQGVAQQLQNFFEDRKTNVVTINNDNHMKAYLRKYKENDFPYFALQITQASPSTENLPHLRRAGVMGGLNASKNYRSRFHLVPTDVTLKVIFAANDQQDVYDFIQQWVYASKSKEFKFELGGNDLEVPINLVLEENLSVPQLENEDIGEMFVFETSMVVKTYVGKVDRTVIIRTTRGTMVDPNNTVLGIREATKTGEFARIERIERD